MSLRILRQIVVPLLMLAVAAPSCAHFQLIYTPIVNLSKATNVPFKLLFWHPFDNGQVMPMGKPEAFYYVRSGRRIDLLEQLRPVTFNGAQNSGGAFDITVPLKRVGDYVFVLVPEPYFEVSEDIYIQQITKSYVNRGGIPGQWSQPLDLPAEIVPLVKPTNVLAGSTFSARVMSAGQPVAGARVEVEFMAAEPDMTYNHPLRSVATPTPGGAIVVITDSNGYFTFGIPRAGFWGFAALDIGPIKEHNAKKLSQDAVLWVRAYDVQ